MSQSVMDRVAAAKQKVTMISPEEAKALIGRDDILFLDVRDADEVAQTGKVEGALNVSRGMLEFRACDTVPTHNPAFSKTRTIIIYCASGGRACLAAETLMDMGYIDVRVVGSFGDCAECGMPTEGH